MARPPAFPDAVDQFMTFRPKVAVEIGPAVIAAETTAAFNQKKPHIGIRPLQRNRTKRPGQAATDNKDIRSIHVFCQNGQLLIR